MQLYGNYRKRFKVFDLNICAFERIFLLRAEKEIGHLEMYLAFYFDIMAK
jgi:hypothetical protein